MRARLRRKRLGAQALIGMGPILINVAGQRPRDGIRTMPGLRLARPRVFGGMSPPPDGVPMMVAGPMMIGPMNPPTMDGARVIGPIRAGPMPGPIRARPMPGLDQCAGQAGLDQCMGQAGLDQYLGQAGLDQYLVRGILQLWMGQG